MVDYSADVETSARPGPKDDLLRLLVRTLKAVWPCCLVFVSPPGFAMLSADHRAMLLLLVDHPSRPVSFLLLVLWITVPVGVG